MDNNKNKEIKAFSTEEAIAHLRTHNNDMFMDKYLRRMFYKDGSIRLWIDDKQTGVLMLNKRNMNLKWRLIKNQSLYSIHTYYNELLVNTYEEYLEDGINLEEYRIKLINDITEPVEAKNGRSQVVLTWSKIDPSIKVDIKIIPMYNGDLKPICNDKLPFVKLR